MSELAIIEQGEQVETYTQEEAEAVDRKVRLSKQMQQIGAFLQYEHKGWKAMGFASFEEYAEERLEVSKTQAYVWVDTVRTSMEARGLSLPQLEAAFNGGAKAKQPLLLAPKIASSLKELAYSKNRLLQAFKEFEDATKENHVATSEKTIQAIVKRILREDYPEVKEKVKAAKPSQKPDKLQAQIDKAEAEYAENGNAPKAEAENRDGFDEEPEEPDTDTATLNAEHALFALASVASVIKGEAEPQREEILNLIGTMTEIAQWLEGLLDE